MPLKAPSILRDWQTLSTEEQQPTCYDQRNPAMPWLPADELGYDDAEDREAAQAWIACPAAACSLGDMQGRSPSGKERADALRASAERRCEASTKTILQQLADAMAPHSTQSR
jgi:hypothetical protein